MHNYWNSFTLYFLSEMPLSWLIFLGLTVDLQSIECFLCGLSIPPHACDMFFQPVLNGGLHLHENGLADKTELQKKKKKRDFVPAWWKMCVHFKILYLYSDVADKSLCICPVCSLPCQSSYTSQIQFGRKVGRHDVLELIKHPVLLRTKT